MKTTKCILFILLVTIFLLLDLRPAQSSGPHGHDGLSGLSLVFAQLTNDSKLRPIQKPVQPVPDVIKRPALRPTKSGTGQTTQGQQTQQDTATGAVSQTGQDQGIFYQSDQGTPYQSDDQSQQGFTSYPDSSSVGTSPPVKAYDSAQTQTDMQRRTGGQARGNVPSGQMQPIQQGMPPQGMPPQGMPQQGMPQQGMPQQGMPPQGMPPQQGMPQQGMQAACKIQLSEDRTSIALIDQSGQEINHVALGQDRVQKIFRSPDGSWNVVVFKVRQRQEYGAIAINLAQCDPQDAREIRSMPDNVEFQGEEMAVQFPGNVVERYSLNNKSAP